MWDSLMVHYQEFLALLMVLRVHVGSTHGALPRVLGTTNDPEGACGIALSRALGTTNGPEG